MPYQIHQELRDKVWERDDGDFNKVAAVFWSQCTTERSSRDICISLHSRKWCMREQGKNHGLWGGEGARGESWRNEEENVLEE